ncbi:MAG: YegP family protein [Eubacteriales bacterium]|nr:YegP family protein [Eubacteriales bacterium]
MAKFQINATKTGFNFYLVAGNGQTIATSQTYKTMASCKNGIASVMVNASAAVEDQTKEGFETIKNPKYELYADKKGEIRFRLKARNGQVICSSEGYAGGVKAALNGISSVAKNAPEAKVVDPEA